MRGRLKREVIVPPPSKPQRPHLPIRHMPRDCGHGPGEAAAIVVCLVMFAVWLALGFLT